MTNQQFILNFGLAINAVLDNKLRTLLTGLGILSGVAAVIAMLGIGAGAEALILEQMKVIGSNNIEVKAITLTAENNVDSKGKAPYSRGLTLADVKGIQEIVTNINNVSPEIIIPTTVLVNGRIESANCVGITNAFFEISNIKIALGLTFNEKQYKQAAPVCIIGQKIAKRLFPSQNPIGKKIKCGKEWLIVRAVLATNFNQNTNLSELGVRDYNDDVFIPTQTALKRFRNRGQVSAALLSANQEEKIPNKFKKYHQLDRVVFHINEARFLPDAAKLIGRFLKRRHNNVLDYEVTVPELLLKQQQQTQSTFNFVLGAIAAISLLVGGIGIMNIMLASVLERIKEIGIRRSLGATRKDIILQFLLEATFISFIGGVLGIILGVVLAQTIARIAEIPTIVSYWSILLSFGVAASVGVIFGFFPARKAAYQDPIKALRSD